MELVNRKVGLRNFNRGENNKRLKKNKNLNKEL